MTFTKEQLTRIIESADEVITALAGTNDDIHPDNSTKMCAAWDDLNDRNAPPSVVKKLAEMALAGMEAVPVFKINHDSSLIKHVKKVVRETSAPHPLTTSERAEPENYRNAQQVVPDELANKSFEYIANKFQVSISDAQWILVGWNACRAATLQGADGEPTDDERIMAIEGIIPVADLSEANVKGWIPCSERMPTQGDYVSAVSRHGEYVSGLVNDEWLELHDGTSFGIDEVYLWMPTPPLPEEPREVK